MASPAPPLIGIAGYSGSGKTTLLAGVLGILNERGLRVAVIKRTRHDVELDQPGKDSHTLRHAGARQVLLASAGRWALVVEGELGDEPGPEDWASRLPKGEQDLVLVEGYKKSPIPKLEVHRPSLGKPLLSPGDPWIRGVASDSPLELPEGVELLDINDHESVAIWLLRHTGAEPRGWEEIHG